MAMKAWVQQKRKKQAWYFDILVSAWLLNEHWIAFFGDYA